jgi:26S proteasome regulatory subunit N7
LLPQMPALATFTKSLYECNYAEFFKSLGTLMRPSGRCFASQTDPNCLIAEVEETYLTPLPVFAPHARYYVREMRIKAYTQILESYKSLTLERMSKAFGVSTTFIDA